MRPAGTRRRPQLSRADRPGPNPRPRPRALGPNSELPTPGPLPHRRHDFVPATDSGDQIAARSSSATRWRSRRCRYCSSCATSVWSPIPIWFYVVVFVASPRLFVSDRQDHETARRTRRTSTSGSHCTWRRSPPSSTCRAGVPRSSALTVSCSSTTLRGAGPTRGGSSLSGRLLGVGTGQLAISSGWAPSFLPTARANALALLGTVRRPLRRPDARRDRRAEGERRVEPSARARSASGRSSSTPTTR